MKSGDPGSVRIVDCIAVSFTLDIFLHLVKPSLFLIQLTLRRFVLRFQDPPCVAPILVVRRVISGGPARRRFIILGELSTPGGKLVLETGDVVLKPYDLPLLYFDLILEYLTLRLKLPDFSSLFLVCLIRGGFGRRLVWLGLGLRGLGQVVAMLRS